MDCAFAHQQLRPCAHLMQQGCRLKRRLAGPDHGNVPSLEGGEAGNPRRVNGEHRRQGCYHGRDISEACQTDRDNDTICDKALAVGERNRKAVRLSCHMSHVDRFDPWHILVLEPMPIGGEIADRAWLKRLQTTRPTIVSERKPWIGRRDVRSEAIRPQIALAAGFSDLRPELHRTAEDTMLYVSRRKMRGQRKTIGPGADNGDFDSAHGNTVVETRRVEADARDVERIKRGKA